MAAGYGEGRVTIGPQIVGHVAVTNVTAVPALSPRIRFGLSWTLGHLLRLRAEMSIASSTSGASCGSPQTTSSSAPSCGTDRGTQSSHSIMCRPRKAPSLSI